MSTTNADIEYSVSTVAIGSDDLLEMQVAFDGQGYPTKPMLQSHRRPMRSTGLSSVFTLWCVANAALWRCVALNAHAAREYVRRAFTRSKRD